MIDVGTLVVAEYRGGTHTGLVLAVDDPRAWAGSIAFSGEPTVEDVRAHLARQPVADKQPVLWSFGKIFWERPAALRALGLGEGFDWVLTRVDTSSQGGLVTEGVNLSDNGRTFFWMLDTERALDERRYDWSRAVITEAAAERIGRHRDMLAARAARAVTP